MAPIVKKRPSTALAPIVKKRPSAAPTVSKRPSTAVTARKRPSTQTPMSKPGGAKKVKVVSKTWNVRHVANELAALPSAPYLAHDAVSAESAADARDHIMKWEGYEAAPLTELPQVAELAGVKSVVAKDESFRFGVGCFKALGGALAVADCQATDPNAVVCTASAGNHGLGVAWGARRAGIDAKVYLGRTVSEAIADKMRAFGAEVVRIDGTYEQSCEQAWKDSKTNGWSLIQDGSSPGYEAVPKRIHSGYALLAREMLEQLGGLGDDGKIHPDKIPTHILANAGVGGLAAGLCGYLWDTLGEHRPRFICVEPANADCCAQQIQRDAYEAHVLAGGAQKEPPPSGFPDEGTIQVGLDCKAVSPLAWRAVGPGTNDFVAIGDEAVGPCLKLLARGQPTICAGESAVAGVGVLLAAGQQPDLKAKLGLDENSRVAVVICEAPPNPTLYEELTGETVAAVRARQEAAKARE
eukprot:TRINITY_DN49107_c0_g1_i1.p1 TRINITY_DN49107_c0_g1~~TRINITY_DN49107_c0_g1_i1.p1  ORF type:complete len:468 (-),score=73.65 TRINITY_DN49107_c0_g1_i1:318-1721(-)